MAFNSSIRHQIREAAHEKKEKLKEKDIFLSAEMKHYLEGLAMTILGKRIEIHLFEGSEDGDVAWTDGSAVYININNSIIAYCPTTEQKFIALMGLFFHEIGHMKFLDFNEVRRANEQIQSGKFYGYMPKSLDAKESADWADMELAMSNPAARMIFVTVFNNLSNIVSDTHDEESMIDMFGSFVGEGIHVCRNALRASCIPFEELLSSRTQGRMSDLSIAYNILLQETRFDSVRCDDHEALENSEFWPLLKRIRPHAKIACVTDDAFRQFSELNYIMLALWPFIRLQLQKMQNQAAEQGQGQSSGQTGASQQQSGSSGQSQNSSGNQSGQSGGSQQTQGQSSGASSPSGNGQSGTQPQGQSGGDQQSVGGQITSDQANEILKQLGQAIRNAGQTKAPQKQSSSETAIDRRKAEKKNGKPAEKQKSTAAGLHSMESTLDKIIGEIATNQAELEVENGAKGDQTNEIRAIITKDANSPHRGVPLRVERNLTVTARDRQVYEETMRELKPISKRLQNQVVNALRDLKDGYVERHRMSGKILVPGDTYRPDDRYFAKKNLPQDLPDMAISVLVDMSGSMGGSRIDTAMKAAMLLHDFATGLDIPISIAGHNTNSGVSYVVFADFDQYSGNDKYRIAKMYADGCNRDGMALMISSGLLEKRPEEIKLLIVISDGKPNHSSYGGKQAEKDIGNIIRASQRKGIEVIAAAIGDDRKQIQEIYKDEFLDISDLSKLPRIMTNIVKKRVLRNAL